MRLLSDFFIATPSQARRLNPDKDLPDHFPAFGGCLIDARQLRSLHDIVMGYYAPWNPCVRPCLPDIVTQSSTGTAVIALCQNMSCVLARAFDRDLHVLAQRWFHSADWEHIYFSEADVRVQLEGIAELCRRMVGTSRQLYVLVSASSAAARHILQETVVNSVSAWEEESS